MPGYAMLQGLKLVQPCSHRVKVGAATRAASVNMWSLLAGHGTMRYDAVFRRTVEQALTKDDGAAG